MNRTILFHWTQRHKAKHVNKSEKAIKENLFWSTIFTQNRKYEFQFPHRHTRGGSIHHIIFTESKVHHGHLSKMDYHVFTPFFEKPFSCFPVTSGFCYLDLLLDKDSSSCFLYEECENGAWTLFTTSIGCILLQRGYFHYFMWRHETVGRNTWHAAR